MLTFSSGGSLGAVDAHPRAVEAHPGAVQANPRAMEARPGAVEAHSGTMEAHSAHHEVMKDRSEARGSPSSQKSLRWSSVGKTLS